MEMTKERIQSTMSIEEAISAMAGGNHGAIMVCVKLIEKSDQIDPDGYLGGLGTLLILDKLGIYDHRLAMLWRDVCHYDLVNLIGLTRAHQFYLLTGIDADTINYAIDHEGEGISLGAMLRTVKQQLPNFNPLVATC